MNQHAELGQPVLEKSTLYASVRQTHQEGFRLDVELTVEPGITILFGSSGAGKTSLLDCLAGLIRPDSGRIVIGERVLFDAEERTDVPAPLRQCGYLFQNLALFPHMTVRENIEYGLFHLRKQERRQRSDAILKSFRIAELANRKPAQASGGERQRVALARALVTDPAFLLLDEPLSGLDAATKSRIMQDLRDWNRSHGIPIIYVTHDRGEVYALGETVVVIEDGRIIAQGTPQTVLKTPRSETIAQLTGIENVFDAMVLAQHEQHGTMTCRLLPPREKRERAVLEQFFRESQLGGAARLPRSPAPTPYVTLEVPLVQVELTGVRIGIHAGDILISVERPNGLSARNLLPVTIRGIKSQGPTVIVETASTEDHDVHFIVHVTPHAVESLALRAGEMVWLVLKTHSCHLLQPANS